MDSKDLMTDAVASLSQSAPSPESTPGSRTRDCLGCGKTVVGRWVAEAVFAGRVVMPAGWDTPERCEACLRRQPVKLEVVDFDPAESERRLVRKLTEIFGGEMPAENHTLGRFKPTFESNEAYKAAHAFSPETTNLWLFGPCGVGKTHLACGIVRECVKRGRTAVYMKQSRLARYVRVKEATVQEQRIQHLGRVDVLVIDELGIGKETEFVCGVMQEILDIRKDTYRNGLILTSNYSPEDYAQKLGEDPIPSRLAGLCTAIKVAGEDRRLKK